jgi:hypothetical protein
LHDDLGALDVALPEDVVQRLEALFATGAVRGSRYNEQGNREVDTEEFA